MAAYYSIIRFSPDEITDERINIGVVVFGEGQSRVHFVENWQRVRDFAGRDVRFLKDFARDAERMSETAIRRAVTNWTHTIQFTTPAPSLLSVDELLLEVASRFLLDAPRLQRGYRLRGQAVRLARREVQDRLSDRIGGLWKLYLKAEKHPVLGARGPHPFDINVGNGHSFFAVQAISFEIPNKVKIAREVDAAAWAIKDVKEAQPSLPIAVFALPPTRGPQDIYDRASSTFIELGAQVVTQSMLSKWAGDVIDQTVQITTQPD